MNSPERMEKWRNFKLLAHGINVQPFLREIDANAKLWTADESRQKSVVVQQHTQSILLRVADTLVETADVRDVQETRYSKRAKGFPLIIGFVNEFTARLRGQIGRILIVRLAPHSDVGRHVDQGQYYTERNRYHLVLKSREGSLLSAGDERVLMREGEMWWFDNKKPHDSVNPSNEWRIHVIFDVKADHIEPAEYQRNAKRNSTQSQELEGNMEGNSVQVVPPLVHMPAISLTS